MTDPPPLDGHGDHGDHGAHGAHGHHDGVPPRLPAERDGRSPLERLALGRLRADVAAMPASDVVQLVLWPETLADWARGAAIAPAVAYNMLARFKPYRRVRERLAHRLDVPGFVLDHLVDAPRPLPAAQRALPADQAADLPASQGDAHAPLAPPPPPAVVEPTVRLPAVRDGTNPIEQRALWRAWHDVAALPASVLVQVALFPETLAQWARRREVPPSMVYAMLAGSATHRHLRLALARRLDLPADAVDQVIDRPRREPARAHPPELPPPPGMAAAGAAPSGARADDLRPPAPDEPRRPAAGADADDGQLGLGF